MPRFVILEHDHPELHWDLMLETGDVLRTWRLAEPPTAIGQSIRAIPIADHRTMYLDYEGPVSGNRGTVNRWDAGRFETDGDRIRLFDNRRPMTLTWNTNGHFAVSVSDD